MRVLRNVKPTAEQLPILNYRPGFVLIRGSAGSGKTTTAVLRLRVVTGVWTRARQRTGDDSPVRVLVLTFNRTLRGYVEQLVEQQVDTDSLDLTLSTFASWAIDVVGNPAPVRKVAAARIACLGAGLGYGDDFLVDEVSYILGRFLPDRIGDYADPTVTSTYERTGRGASPRVDRAQRARLLDEVVYPLIEWKSEQGVRDWNDLPVEMALRTPTAADRYDIALVDEAQDFSANQIRAVVRHLAESHSTAFVLDAVQRIYPHGFDRWTEVGVDIPGANSFRLRQNHRNTKQIAAFARPLVKGLPLDEDGTPPDPDSCVREGPKPTVVRGLFRDQMSWVLDYVRELPEDESVAILHAKGGHYLDFARARLGDAGIAFVEMQGQPEWPQGPEQVGLNTLHSAKGLEFDHAIIIGLNADLMPHGPEEDDSQLATHRRLVAMAASRARESAVLTYKPDEASRIIDYLDPATFDSVDV